MAHLFAFNGVKTQMNKQMHYVLGEIIYVDDSLKCKTLSDLPQTEPNPCRACAGIDWLQSLKQLFINVPYHMLVASLTLIAIRVKLGTGIRYGTLMKYCFKDWIRQV